MAEGQRSSVLGGLKRVMNRAAVATGFADEVRVVGGDGSGRTRPSPSSPPIPRNQPVIPAAIAPATPRVSEPSPDPDVEEQFRAHFPEVLQATPSAFQRFLAQRDTLMESLRETGVPPDRLMGAATKAALSVANLTPKDVEEAMRAARAALGSLHRDLDASLAERRQELVDNPRDKIAEMTREVDRIVQQIAELERRKLTLAAGIPRQQEEVREAEGDLAYAATVVNSCCGRIEQALAVMEQQLTQRGGKA